MERLWATLLALFLCGVPLSWGSEVGPRTLIESVASDSLEIYLAAPDSVVGFSFDYREGQFGGTAPRYRTRGFVNHPAVSRHVLSAGELASLRDVIRKARAASDPLDDQFWACCGAPRWGFELYRHGHQASLGIHVCACCAGWRFQWHQYSVGGLVAGLGNVLEGECSHLCR